MGNRRHRTPGTVMTAERFISEALTPLTAGADTARMAGGEPGLPERFRWRGRIVEIHRLLRSWKSTGPCSHGSPEHYVRRHWFEVTSNCGRLKIYFERQPRRGARGPRWWLYSQSDSTAGPPPEG